jgi:predicted secreted protein
MAFYDGSAYKLYVSKVGADNSTPLVGESTSTLNITADALEVSDKSSAWKQYIAGMRGATLSATLYADDEDASQKLLISSLMAGDTVKVRLARLVGQSYKGEYSAQAIITSIGLTMQNGGVASRDVSFQITGAVNVTIQTSASEE